MEARRSAEFLGGNAVSLVHTTEEFPEVVIIPEVFRKIAHPPRRSVQQTHAILFYFIIVLFYFIIFYFYYY